jgi:hypothetical protein
MDLDHDRRPGRRRGRARPHHHSAGCARSHRADGFAAILISDEPLSKETNYLTELVAVLSDQPQGGFLTRKPTVNVAAKQYPIRPTTKFRVFTFFHGD